MRALVKTALFKEPQSVKETYQTLKNRARDSQRFIEMTDILGTKCLYHKDKIGLIAGRDKFEKPDKKKRRKKTK